MLTPKLTLILLAAPVWAADPDGAALAHGGSTNHGGPAIANGMVFTNSGYAGFGGSPENVPRAFSVDGK
jgi:hypothetical protein